MRAIALLLVCACGSKETEPPPPTKLPAPEVRPLGTDRLPQPTVDLPKQLSFKLLERGTGDASPLRYAVAETEATTKIEMTLTSRSMTDGTWTARATLAPIRTGLATASTGAGQLRARALPGEIAGTTTAVAEAYLAGWKASEGRRLAIGFDPRGQLGALTFADDPTGARSRQAIDDMTQRLLSIVVPVPEEPVGIGASWRVVTVLFQPPVVVKQTATYTLLGRTDRGWKVGVDLQRVGEEQTVTDPTQAPDAMVDLVALVRRYKGTLEIAPHHALPTGSIALESTIHVRIQPRGKPMVEQMLEDQGTVTLTAGP